MTDGIIQKVFNDGIYMTRRQLEQKLIEEIKQNIQQYQNEHKGTQWQYNTDMIIKLLIGDNQE